VLVIATQRRRARETAELEHQLMAMARTQNELTGRLQSLAEAATTGQSELKRSLDERLDQVSHRLGQGLNESARRTGENLTRLHERLAVIDTAQKNISELSSRVVGLQEILGNKQARGAFGQGRMEAIVADGLPKGAYSFQHTLSNGKRPDCAVILPDTDQVIVIDAKFPLEGFTARKSARDAQARREADARVRADLGRHIADIVTRYRVPGEVQETLILFVPSESTYAEIYEDFDDVIQKAYRARVIIVSPNMLMLAVSTMQAIMKDAHMRKQASIIQTEVMRLIDDVGRLGDRVADLKKHFGQAGQDIDRIAVSAEKISNRGRKIEALDFDDEVPAKAPAKSAPQPMRTLAGGQAA
jgi:DNA recombination protein RmuC